MKNKFLAFLHHQGSFTVAAKSGIDVENLSGGLPSIQNLGTAADLYLAADSAGAAPVVIGATTPWGGVAGGVTAPFIGTVSPLSAFKFAGGSFGDGTPASFSVLAASPVAATVINTTSFNNPSADFSGLSSITVTGRLNLLTANALGGGNNTAPVPLSIAANGTVSINSLALNGPVAVHTGAILSFANPISGTGSLSRDAGPITFNINGPNAFTGTQLTPAFTRPGDTINLAAGNLVNLSALNPAATYVLSFSGAATQAEDYHLDGGALRIASTYTLVSSTASGIRIGDNGGTLQATGTATITVPITATGTLSIGSAPSDNFGHGFVILKSTNTLPAVVVNNAGLSVGSPATLGTGPITLNSASLQLYPVADANNLALYPNTLTISGDSNLYDFLNPFNLRPGYNTRIAPALSLARVNYQSALTLRISKLTIADLHMTGDGTITSPGGIIVISTLSADTSPRTLTLNTTSSRASFQVTDSVAPNLSLTLTNADLLLAAPQDPASVTAFYIATASTLTFATDYDFTTGPTLAGFGHVIIAAGNTLTLPIDTAYAGTIQVNGTLVLAPALNPANAHRVPAFFILPTPEPTSLSLLLLASPLLLRRKR